MVEHIKELINEINDKEMFDLMYQVKNKGVEELGMVLGENG